MSAPTSTCLNIGTLQIIPQLAVGAVPPANGYKVRYRIVGTTIWTYLPTQNSNPILITNVPLCNNIEGYIQSDCGDGNYGIDQSFIAQAAPLPCKLYKLIGVGTSYTFYMCNQSVPTTIINQSADGTIVCAVEGTVSGAPINMNMACNA